MIAAPGHDGSMSVLLPLAVALALSASNSPAHSAGPSKESRQTTTAQRAAPQPLLVRAVERRVEASRDARGDVVLGAHTRTRIEHFDARGRLQRWEHRSSDGSNILTWVGAFLDDGPAPARAAYWTGENETPSHELFVRSPDGRFHDVLYADAGETARRQLREYYDAAGREIYQEYFAPRSQRRYGEEFYRYDGDGNELGRLWRRIDGKASKRTDFEILACDEHGRWTARLVSIDGKLAARDDRTMVLAAELRPRPSASAGPVEPSTAILPIPFAAGVISTEEGENMLTFGPDGREALFTRYGDDWRKQRGLLARWTDGAWREPEPLPFAGEMYNAALSADGQRVIHCQRDDSMAGARVFLTERTQSGWGTPTDLTARDGLMGSYFCLLANGTLYFHLEGDLHRCSIGADATTTPSSLGAPVNTTEGTEFGAWVDADEELLLFTRSVENEAEASGVFVSRRASRTEPWGPPRRLPIPYGWGAVLTPDGEDLVYVVDDDVVRVPVSLLDLR